MGRPDDEVPTGVIEMTAEAVHTVRRRFTTTGQTLYNMSEDLPDAWSDLGTAVGQFYQQIDEGLSPFTASWQASFSLCEDEARLIAGNTSRLSIDLDRLDIGHS
ncbi:MAG: hypothetical protein HOQ22_16315 [Nocardioidaceae bacterium]|nr:hypothetical protein [Nocardioidaceae bacterium]NUS52591.1 hypothetical protein [Nocardioidaceae bacterium]